MAYVKSTVIPLSGLVSLQPNNLSFSGDHVAYVRMNEVVLVSIITGESRKMPISSKCVIYQAALMNVNRTEFLVIASSEGTQVWTVDGMELKFFLPINTTSVADPQGHFSNGITGTDNGYICTGTSAGNVVVINVPRGGEGITFFDSLDTKESPISTLGSSIMLLAAGNDNGDIYGFDPNSAFESVCRFAGSGFPCTSLVVKDDYIFAGFMNGKLRLYRVSPVQEMSVEISAHARTINAICMHPSQYLAASVSDDQMLHVWSVPDYSAGSYTSAEVNLFCSSHLENKKLTGVAFLSDDRIGVVAYDDDELTIFSRN